METLIASHHFEDLVVCSCRVLPFQCFYLHSDAPPNNEMAPHRIAVCICGILSFLSICSAFNNISTLNIFQEYAYLNSIGFKSHPPTKIFLLCHGKYAVILPGLTYRKCSRILFSNGFIEGSYALCFSILLVV